MPTVGPLEANSIPALLHERARATPDAEAFRFPDDGGWSSVTWAQAEGRVRELAAGLRALGVGDERRVAIIAGTRFEWILADLAVLAAGGATTTVYPSSSHEETALILADSDSLVVIAEDAEQVAKLRAIRADVPGVAHVRVIDADGCELDDWVRPLAEVAADGGAREAADPDAYERGLAAITPERLATLIYTSGTTGRPKGVELAHDNWLYASGAVAELGILRPDDLHFLWLPLSHSFGKVLEVAMIAVGVPTAVDGRVERIAANLAELHPTIVAAAPRIFEKIHNTVTAKLLAEGGVKLRLFRWAREVGVRHTRARQAGRTPSPGLRAQYAVADRLVFSKLRERFGGAIRYFVSGSAPLSLEMAEFFDAAGMTILEGYGLTETSAASFVNRPGRERFGTVGHPLPGTEVRIGEDGEVLIRGRGVMRGYHGLPEETATTLVDGWLHTGDIGELDDDGRLRITDRKKDLIKTSAGKYVAPQYVEGKIKAACPYVGNVFVYGDGRNYCTALVTLDVEALTPWAAGRGLSTEPASLAEDPQVRALVADGVRQANQGLASHETVKRFAILAADFSVDDGSLTPSLKMRRAQILDRHAGVLDTLYEDAVKRV